MGNICYHPGCHSRGRAACNYGLSLSCDAFTPQAKNVVGRQAGVRVSEKASCVTRRVRSQRIAAETTTCPAKREAASPTASVPTESLSEARQRQHNPLPAVPGPLFHLF